MKDVNSVVAIFKQHSDAEAAIKLLQSEGFDMKKLSIIGREYHADENVVGFYNTGDRMASWGKFGAFWGMAWGLLFGSGLFLIPGVGTVMVAGPIVTWIVGAIETAVVVGGLTALGAALYSIGIPKNSVIKYETAIKADKFVVVAHGTLEEVEKAKSLIEKSHAEEADIYKELAASPR